MMTMSMVVWALKGTLVLACGALVSLLLRKAPAALRHLVWTAALAGALALPMLEGSGLAPRIAAPGWWPGTAAASQPSGQSGVAPADAAVRVDGASRDVEVRGSRLLPSQPAVTATQRMTAGRDAQPQAARATAGSAAEAPVRSALVGDGSLSSTMDGDASAGVGGRLEGTSVAAVSARARPMETTGGWPAAIVAIWLAGAVALLGWTLLAHLKARRLTGHLAWAAPPEPTRRARALAKEMGIRTPVRVVVAPVSVPATWGLRGATVVLPERHAAWPPARLERVLLHELAHIQRRDCASQLLGDVARALRWYDPLAWLAVHRQRLESERACDDAVLAYGATASAYAEDLLQLGRTLRSRSALPRAALAMARESGLGGRIRGVLDTRRSRGRVSRRTAMSVALPALVLTSAAAGLTPAGEATEPPVVVEAVAAVPAASSPAEQGIALLPSQPRPSLQSRELCVARENEGLSTNVQMNDDVVRIRWETDSCRIEIDMEGEVEFTSDDRGIARMAEGALFEVEERADGVERRARFEGDSRGAIERRYWVEGRETPWGLEADQWVAEILPALFRHTTINAEARVRRMLEEGGPARVFDEVELIRSDHVAATYLELLMNEAQLSETELVRVISFTDEIESDHTSANLLLGVVDRAGLRPAFQAPMLRATAGIESDHEKGRVLSRLLQVDLPQAQLDAVVRAAATIESDHEQATVLSAVARKGQLSVAGREAFMDAVAGIDSDHSQGNVVNAFLDAGPLTADELSAVLGLTRGIESDHERATILRRVASEYDLSGAQVTAYLEAARDIESDHEAGATAAAIIEQPSFSAAQLDLVLSLAEGVESDHKMASILQAVIRRRELEQAEAGRVVEATARIGSDHQKSTTLVLLTRQQELAGPTVLAVVEAAAGIASDHNRAEVLVAVAEGHAIEGAALERYRELAEGMSSSQRDRVLAALVR